jgi:hypothetical protein
MPENLTLKLVHYRPSIYHGNHRLSLETIDPGDGKILRLLQSQNVSENQLAALEFNGEIYIAGTEKSTPSLSFDKIYKLTEMQSLEIKP